MKIESVEAYYVESATPISGAELIERSGLSEEELRALVDAGALVPDVPAGSGWSFTVQCLTVARTAQRLRDELAIDDAHDLTVVLRFAQRVAALEGELQALRQRVGRRG